MNNQPEAKYSIIQDSLALDTANHTRVPKTGTDTSKINLQKDTFRISETSLQRIPEDSISDMEVREVKTDTSITKTRKNKALQVAEIKSDKEKISQDEKAGGENLKRFPAVERYNFADTVGKEFTYKPEKTFLLIRGDKHGSSGSISEKVFNSQKLQLNWTLVIGLVSILLLLSLKKYYQKFISQVATTLVNFQMAEKMLREKNIVVRRAFFMLNLNYILILSLFLLTLTIYWEFRISNNYIQDYFILVGIVVVVVLLRIIIFYAAGFLFGTNQAMIEHIHISFLVNKNLGLIMLPLVFIILYTTPEASEITIYLCLGLLILATFYKIFRGFQIIIRNGVFIFYAFLYLCTLELLPLVLGSKLIISLR